jgi:hypothetical protein
VEIPATQIDLTQRPKVPPKQGFLVPEIFYANPGTLTQHWI